ncbi:MAG: NrfD/PsrC family molybdoenzyme membrane anchor subunit [Planctomycetota bacterium]|jgi:Ni/Fe-hydrogenase subunit HybB-like protein
MHEEIQGFLFPNDVHIIWDLMIVMYPYITGLVAGAFIVSSLYHVFGRKELKPIARLALVSSLAFLIFAIMPLVLHAGRPERSLNILITPNFSSAMAGFGLLFNGYLILVLLEIWTVYRQEIILLARRSRGFWRWFYAALALGVYDSSKEAKDIDRRMTIVLAAIGIPLACLLHGYVGFIFGALKSNFWWSTPLMPIIFLFSAMVSGIAVLVILYQALMKFTGRAIDGDCMQSLCRWLWLFTIMTVTLETLEIITLAYERSEEWAVIGPLLGNQLAFSFIGVQMVLGAMIPIILLGIVVLMQPFLTSPLRNTIALIASMILLIQVFAMRWNVVIGGQIFSKSMRGYRESYQPELLGVHGVLGAMILLALPFIFLSVFNRILPLFETAEPPVTRARTDSLELQESQEQPGVTAKEIPLEQG